MGVPRPEVVIMVSSLLTRSIRELQQKSEQQ